MNYRNIINKGASILRKNTVSTANLDAEILLSKSLNKTREEIILNLEEKLNAHQINYYYKLINRRKKKEPISLIIKKKYFWKSEFVVNKNVLTPRFETEFLVEEVLKIYKLSKKIHVLDIGLGSGCILISLLKERNIWQGTGLDISSLAIENAKTNAKIQQVYNRIRFIKSDIDKFYIGKYDLIVSNPPYINKIGYNKLDIGVKGYEPKKALYGGIDGFEVIEKVIKKSRIILKSSGFLAMEIGFDQYNKASEILRKNGFVVVKKVKDYQNINRCLFAKKIR
jgi:release factor glutamine methyltransferase